MAEYTNFEFMRPGNGDGYQNNNLSQPIKKKPIPLAANQIILTPNSPEEWERAIRAVENKIGHPSTWTFQSHKMLQNKLNEYKNWRENTPKGRAVIDYHNEPNEYVVPLPSHLEKMLKVPTVAPVKRPVAAAQKKATGKK